MIGKAKLDDQANIIDTQWATQRLGPPLIESNATVNATSVIKGIKT